MTRTFEQFTDADVARLEQLCAALDDNVVAFTWNDAGACSLSTTDRAEARLVDVHGGPKRGKSNTLHQVKRVAAAHGRPVPRSLADALADPVLVALSARAS